MAQHEVIVGNIGLVYYGANETSARRTYGTYCRASKSNSGKASGESVLWLKDDEIYQEYLGTREDE